MEQVRIVIVDDHKIIRDGLEAILKQEPAVKVVGSAGSSEKLMEILNTITVDLIVLDMHMPAGNGIQITTEVKDRYPGIKIVINTMSELPEEIEKAINAGADGYLLKNSGSQELIRAIKTVAGSQNYYGDAVLYSFIKNVDDRPSAGRRQVTDTELKIITMLYAEMSHQEIAGSLNIKSTTLTTHLQNMFRKLKVQSEVGLIKFAIAQKLL